ncbi:hypothetical protein EHS25_007335 [Saitozyma podzolica]|uniref:Uncharacterized protein n=1 Tax=Saitozyma podzolica TaxID=1890683 RepID=A0A427XMH7_9TREE|nr:hypothetical protein EHS25_007335 [Saitozyma podzolica]
MDPTQNYNAQPEQKMTQTGQPMYQAADGKSYPVSMLPQNYQPYSQAPGPEHSYYGGQQPIAYPQPVAYHQPGAYPQQGQMYPAPSQPGMGAGSHSGAGAGAGAGAAAGLCGKSTHSFAV